mmetsp:Transcript_23161/g.66856  ORF Transcript_23161/g.66856 Transcript_23161/m.66856 type:complete len:211 (+) Transcript_23161:884-1516(+)
MIFDELFAHNQSRYSKEFLHRLDRFTIWRNGLDRTNALAVLGFPLLLRKNLDGKIEPPPELFEILARFTSSRDTAILEELLCGLCFITINIKRPHSAPPTSQRGSWVARFGNLLPLFEQSAVLGPVVAFMRLFLGGLNPFHHHSSDCISGFIKMHGLLSFVMPVVTTILLGHLLFINNDILVADGLPLLDSRNPGFFYCVADGLLVFLPC